MGVADTYSNSVVEARFFVRDGLTEDVLEDLAYEIEQLVNNRVAGNVMHVTGVEVELDEGIATGERTYCDHCGEEVDESEQSYCAACGYGDCCEEFCGECENGYCDDCCGSTCDCASEPEPPTLPGKHASSQGTKSEETLRYIFEQ